SLSVSVFRRLSEHAAGRQTLTEGQRGRLLEYARGNVADWPSPADLADQVDLTPAYFARVFRDSFGRSPRQWLVEVRSHQAARLLPESTLSITEAADRLGYRDVFLFSRQFKQVMGLSPKAYRRGF